MAVKIDHVPSDTHESPLVDLIAAVLSILVIGTTVIALLLFLVHH
jgi:hypothetical protein